MDEAGDPRALEADGSGPDRAHIDEGMVQNLRRARVCCWWRMFTLMLSVCQLSSVWQLTGNRVPMGLLATGIELEEQQLQQQRHQFLIDKTQELKENHEPANNEKPFASMLISAVINGKVSLACDINPASPDDSVTLILWYKDDSLAPIYTIDARKADSLERARTSLDESLAARASFDMSAKPAFLHLEPVKQEDEGDYRCRVDFKRGRTVNTIISLRVVVLPEEVRIVSSLRPNLRLEGLVGPFNEGSELQLSCLAVGGKPRPQISWRHELALMDDTNQHVDKDGTSNELRIPSLTKNHLLSSFTCQASNNNITAPLKSTITIDLNLKPQEISLKQLVQEPLVVGQSATFECLTQGSRPQASIHWLFSGIRHDEPMNVDQQQTSSRLTLTLQRSFNQQLLTCIAENPRIPHSSAIRQTIKLDVHYPPQLRIKLEPPHELRGFSSNHTEKHQPDSSQLEQTQLQEGNDIYLTCLVDANPRPIKPIVWRFNGRPLSQASSSVVINNQSLVLRKVTRQQSGLYSCNATNLHGSNSSKPVELVIRYAPVCASNDILVYEAAIGQTVNLNCNVLANPSSSVHFSWFSARPERNLSTWIQRDVADQQMDESSSRLKLNIKDEHSFGLLKCKAKNEIGIQQKACLFQLVPAPTPSLKHACSLSSVSSVSLQVMCEPNEHLKSEDFELLGGQDRKLSVPPVSSISSWLNLEAIKHQTGTLDPNGGTEPNLRLIFPPNWILVELYKVLPGSTRGGNDNSSDISELLAYVVAGSSQQLAHIKSIVEENRLLSANPKSVYYVIAKDLNARGTSKGELGHQEPSLMVKYQQHIQMAHQSRVHEDPNIQLASSFVFTVPNLEPQSRYKLLIYGHNLANKTSDWLVVQGETLKEDASSKYLSSVDSTSQISANLLGSNLLNSASVSPRQETDNQIASSNHSVSLQQKSIVMRSDNDNSEQQSDLQQTNEPFDRSIIHTVSSSSLRGRIQQFAAYKDMVFAYAKRKPLLAIPMIATVMLVVVLAFAWTGNLVVHLFRTKPANSQVSQSKRPENTQKKNQNSDLADSKRVRANQVYLPSYSSNSSSASNQYPSVQQSPTLKHSSSSFLIEEQPGQLKQATVYTINGPSVQFDPSGSDLSKVYPLAPQPAQRGHFCGSLDRRELAPIYLTDADRTLIHVLDQQHQFGSIDRKTGSFVSFRSHQAQPKQCQEPMLITELTQFEHGVYLDSAANQELVYTGHQTGSSRARQRVAFDLGEQPLKQYFYHPVQVSPIGDQQGARLVVSPQVVAQQEQVKMASTGKSSDSGGSNSVNTADSGHESPPTGETNSNSFAVNQVVHASACSRNSSSARGAGEIPKQRCPRHHLKDPRVSPNEHECFNHQSNKNLLMLMELSPGSQESSTLLHSVDSFAEFPVGHLHNNHQMATSFTTNNNSDNDQLNGNLLSSEKQQSQLEQSPGSKDLNHWL